MVAKCCEYLQEKIIAAMGRDFMGDGPQVFTSLKDLRTCSDVRCAAILTRSDKNVRNGRPRKNLDTGEDDLMLYDRTLTVDVVLGEDDKEKLDAVFETFISSLDRGIRHNGHVITIELEEAEWVEKKDSIVNAQIAVELPVVFKGGIYRRYTYKQIADISIERQE